MAALELLAKELCSLLDENVKPLYDGLKGRILERYNGHLYKLNEATDFKEGTKLFSGVVKEVNESGNIIIDTDGVEKAYQSGQIEWLQ